MWQEINLFSRENLTYRCYILLQKFKTSCLTSMHLHQTLQICCVVKVCKASFQSACALVKTSVPRVKCSHVPLHVIHSGCILSRPVGLPYNLSPTAFPANWLRSVQLTPWEGSEAWEEPSWLCIDQNNFAYQWASSPVCCEMNIQNVTSLGMLFLWTKGENQE